MNQRLSEQMDHLMHGYRKNKKMMNILLIAIVVVAAATGLVMSHPATTATVELICGQEEHTHTDSCYTEEKTLICGLEEEEADEENGIEGHTHTDACYETERILTCGQEEHVHSADCYEQGGTLSSETSDRMTAEVTYDAGVIHYNTSLSAKLLTDSKAQPAEDKIEEQLNEDDQTADVTKVYDLTLIKNENEVEPEGTVSVVLDFETPVTAASGTEAASVTWHIYHLTDAGKLVDLTQDRKTAIETNGSNAVTRVSFETDSFSEYVLTGAVDIVEEEAEAEDNSGEADEEETYSVGLMAANNSNDSSSTTSGMNITSVSIKVNGNDYDANTTYQATDKLNITLNYTVAPKTLSTDNPTVTYQLPEGIKIANEATGNIVNGDEIVGTYKITTDGQMVFTYNDSYVSQNADGAEISATAAFSASIDEEKIGEDNKTKIKFTDDIEYTINVEKSEVGDLSVNKSAATPDFEKGYIEYTVKVSSTAGTSKEVTISDVITNSDLITSIGDFTVSPAISQTVTPTNEGFTFTVPAMEENSSYTITYKAYFDKSKVPADGITVGNTIKAESEASKGTKLEPSQTVNTSVKPNVLNKSGKYNSETGKVEWTITLNASKLNLKGWTLKDTFRGADYTGTVNVSPSINGSSTITLPYTFTSDDTNTYTITYSTEMDQLIGDNTVYNKAELIKGDGGDGGNVSTGDKNPDGYWSDYNPLDKNASSITASDDGTTAIVKWTVDINASKGNIDANWVYRDELWDGQWFTGTQLKAIKTAIDKAIEGKNLTYTMTANLQKDTDDVGDEVSYDKIQGDAKYKVYTLTFTSTLAKGQTIHYEYESTAPIEGVTTEKAFRNSAYVESNGKKVSDSGEIKYTPPESTEPTIDKKDGNEQNDSNHTISSATEAFDWDLTLKIPSGYTGGELKVVENLPEGVEVTYFEILAQDVFGASNITTAGDHKIDSYTVNTAVSDYGSTYTITIPENLVEAVKKSSNEIRFVVRVKVKRDFKWGTDSNGYQMSKFNNTVTLIDKDNKNIGSDSQAQTITINDGTKLLSKSVTNIDSYYSTPTAIDQIDYSLVVNPEGKNLVEGSDEIILTDELSYEWNPWDLLLVTYARGSLKVYNMNADGTKGTELSTDEYSFVYTESENGMTQKSTATRTLQITLPDGKPLIVEYTYLTSRQDGAVNKWSGVVSNKASLEGYSENKDKADSTVSVLISDSSATARLEGAVLRKVDSANYNISLAGAEFDLYKYDSKSDSYIKVDKTYTTDSNGTISFTTSDITYETAYKLVETKAPEGYLLPDEPFYFIVTKQVLAAGEIATYNAPSDFEGSVYEAGKSFYYGNEKIPEKGLTVKKKWVDSHGFEITDESTLPASIQVKLLKNGEDTEKVLTLSKSEDWKTKVTGLDADATYTVKEISQPDGYNVLPIEYTQYDEKGKVEKASGTSVSGDSYGEAVITNQKATKSLVVQKEWVDEYGDVVTGPDGVDSITVNVKNSDDDIVATKQLNAANNWRETVEGLDKSTVYTVEEESVSGYTQLEIRYIDSEGNVQTDGATNNTAKAIISNQKETKSLVVQKKWLDEYGDVVTGPDAVESITVNVKNSNGEVVAKKELNSANNWRETVEGLDRSTVYTVEEESISGYTQLEISYIDNKGNVQTDGAAINTATAIISNQKNAPTPETGTTNLLVRKKWVGLDGVELPSSETADLEATVQVVRYKAEQQGTVVHFIKNTNTSDVKEYTSFYSDIVVKSDKSDVTISFSSSNWNQDGMYAISSVPEYPNEWNKGFWDFINGNSIQKITASYSGTADSGIQTYTFSTKGVSEIYLYCLESISNNFNLTDGITIASGSEGTSGDAVLDSTYKDTELTLSKSNSWKDIITGLPLSGTEDGKTYAYTYAIKEVSCSEGFTLESYSTGQKGVDTTNNPISNSGDLIIVTNKQKEAYELPITGGSGTTKLILSGLALMMIAILLFIRKRIDAKGGYI